MTTKDRLAATLINYWYVVERGLGIHRLKKVPPVLEAIKSLDGYEKMKVEAVQDLVDSVAAYNSKAFADNLEELLVKDKSVGDFGAEVVCQKLKATFRAALQMPKDMGAEVEALRIALNTPEQNVELKRAIENLPAMVVGDSRSSLNVDASCAIKHFFRSFFSIETEFMASWNAAKVLLFIHKTVLPKLDAEIRAEVLSGRAFLVLRDCKLVDGSFNLGERFEVMETPATRDARIIREKLQKALKLRFQQLKGVVIKDGTALYSFQDDKTSPLKIELDVVTHW